MRGKQVSDIQGDELVRKGKSISSKIDFAEFVELLFQNYRNHPDEWENDSLGAFLQGLVGFVRDMEGYYQNFGIEVDLDRPGWREFADVLLAARVYE